MVFRLPILLKRRIVGGRAKAEGGWFARPERGASWGPRLTLFFYRLLGKRLSSALLQPVLAYFFATDTKGRKASRDYLCRVWRLRDDSCPLTWKPGVAQSYRHYREFAESLLDRFGLRMGRSVAVEWEGREHLQALANGRRGALLVSAHFGSVDLLRVLAHDLPDVRVRVLLFSSNARRVNDVFRSLNKGVEDAVVALESITIESAIQFQEYVDRGDLLGVLGDRVSAHSPTRSSRVEFLGGRAPFPHGPWILASLLKCPVLLLYAVKSGRNTYRIICEPFVEQVALPRGRRTEILDDLTGRYARHLERLCLRFPYQWYNFYDFWASEPPGR
jgi:predicted LPLAT superfamily acyltransferase